MDKAVSIRAVQGRVIASVIAVMVTLGLWTGPAEADEGERAEAGELSECDRFMEAYSRSSARKIGRALVRGEGRLSAFEQEEELTVRAKVDGEEREVVFEVFLEHGGRVKALVDEQREWRETYFVAQTPSGPVVISQRWQRRHLREAGQECEPITSHVISPPVIASTIELEPFEYWGLRVAWRIPGQDSDKFEAKALESILRSHMGEEEPSDEPDDEGEHQVHD